MSKTHLGYDIVHRRIGVILAFLLFLPQASILASPKDPAEKRPTLAAESDRPVLVAKRRRYRRYKKRKRTPTPRRRRRIQPKPEPAPEATPDSDLSSHTTTTPAPAVDPGALQRGGRVEFDGRLVQGQTAKSGAIYLFARKRSQLRSMVEERTSFRQEILRTVYPRWKKEPK